MKLNVEILPPYNIACMRRVGKYGPENYELMEALKQWAKEYHIFEDERIIFGIAQDDPEEIASENCRYDVGITIQEEEIFAEELFLVTVEGGKYLVVEVEHTVAGAIQFWNNVNNIVHTQELTFDTTRKILEQYPIQLIKEGYCNFCIPIR